MIKHPGQQCGGEKKDILQRTEKNEEVSTEKNEQAVVQSVGRVLTCAGLRLCGAGGTTWRHLSGSDFRRNLGAKVKAIKREPWVFTGEHQMSKNNRIGGRKLGSATNLPRDLAYVILLFGPQFRHLTCDETGLKNT